MSDARFRKYRRRDRLGRGTDRQPTARGTTAATWPRRSSSSRGTTSSGGWPSNRSAVPREEAERETAFAALRRELGLDVTREQLIADLFGELVGGVRAEEPAEGGAVRVEQVGRRPGSG